MLARMLAHTLERPVAAADTQRIRDSLAVVAERGDVSGAWVWSEDEHLLGQHGDGAPLSAAPAQGGLAQGSIVVNQPILNANGSRAFRRTSLSGVPAATCW